jgi:hypothetical protein
VGLNVLFFFSQTIPIKKRDIQCLCFLVQISFESHFPGSFFFPLKFFLWRSELQRKILEFETLRIKGTCPSKNLEVDLIFPIENSRFPTATLPSFTFSEKHHLSDE